MKEVYLKKNELGGVIKKHFDKDLISVENLIELIEELDYNIKILEEKIEDIEQDIEDNYNPKSASSLYGINDRDFI